jgi:site-specific DNA-adenine methylase
VKQPALKAPFPAFGGKSRIADLVWARLGNVRNAIEPFCFSSAWLLRRPHEPQVETINDLNHFVANFWRAVQTDPAAVAMHADWPVNEDDLHARHRWLVQSEIANEAMSRVRAEPDFFDAKIAGWWCWGACCWIGSGWCDDTPHRNMGKQRPFLTSDGAGNGVMRNNMPFIGDASRGVNSSNLAEQVPDLQGDAGATGRGVVASAGHKRLQLSCGNTTHGTGVHAAPSGKMPRLNGARKGDGYYGGLSVHVDEISTDGRPQLADAYARGRGVHGNDALTKCEARREWVTDWMIRLSNRLRSVRVCCGHWMRVCDSPSTMTRLGLTGVFLDPPYRKQLADGTTNRSSHIYANDRTQDVNALCDEVQEWCLNWGDDPQVRIALCGLNGEYPKLDHWEQHAWKSQGGYGNRNKTNDNAKRERIWFSPHCLLLQGTKHATLFDKDTSA